MSWAEIKKAVNSDLNVPLDELILNNTDQCIIAEHDLIRDYVNVTYWSIPANNLATGTEQVLVSIDVPSPIEIIGIFYDNPPVSSYGLSKVFLHTDSNKKVDYAYEDTARIYIDGEVILTGNAHLNATTQDLQNTTLYTTSTTEVGTQFSMMPRKALDVDITGQSNNNYTIGQKIGYVNISNGLLMALNGEMSTSQQYTSRFAPEVPELTLATVAGGYNNVNPKFSGYRIITLNDKPIKCASNFKITIQRNFLYGSTGNQYSFNGSQRMVIPYRLLT